MKKKILIIEDDVKQADILKKVLCEKGYMVDVVYTGNAAKEKDFTSYNLVLLDLILPGIGGLELIKGYNPEDLKKAHVVVLTNSTNKDFMAEMTEAGVKAYFIKSDTKLGSIIEAVKELLA